MRPEVILYNCVYFFAGGIVGCKGFGEGAAGMRAYDSGDAQRKGREPEIMLPYSEPIQLAADVVEGVGGRVGEGRVGVDGAVCGDHFARGGAAAQAGRGDAGPWHTDAVEDPGYEGGGGDMAAPALASAELIGKNPEPVGGGGGGIDAGAIDDSAETSLLAADAAAQQQQLRLQNNEDQIMQRDRAIQDIESTVADVAEIMQDLAVVVHTQDGLIDNIEQAVEQTVEDTKAAGQELTKAEGYQKKSRKVILCLFPILVITLGVVILLIWKPWEKK